jgi:hypothetical protein
MTRREHVPGRRLDDRQDSVGGVGSELLRVHCTGITCLPDQRLLLVPKCGGVVQVLGHDDDYLVRVHALDAKNGAGAGAGQIHGLVTLTYSTRTKIPKAIPGFGAAISTI